MRGVPGRYRIIGEFGGSRASRHRCSAARPHVRVAPRPHPPSLGDHGPGARGGTRAAPGGRRERVRHLQPHRRRAALPAEGIEGGVAGGRQDPPMARRGRVCRQDTQELRAEGRVVARNADFVTFAPFASEHPYETWVVPLEHAADFGTLSDGALGSLAELLVDTLARLRAALADPPYSVALHAGPLDGGAQAEFHWHWEIVPHLGHELGMEWATGIFSNPVSPEEAARQLRTRG